MSTDGPVDARRCGRHQARRRSTRDVNTVFQDYALFPHMSVLQNVEYGLRVKRVPRKANAAARRRGGARRRSSSRQYGDRRPQPALRRSAPAGRAGPVTRQPATGPPPRRAAGALDLKLRRADAGGAQGAAARPRDHLPVRHPRPGGSPHDERPDRGLQRGLHRAGRDTARSLRAAGHTVRGRFRRHVQRASTATPSYRAARPNRARSVCGRRRSSSTSTPLTTRRRTAVTGERCRLARSSTSAQRPRASSTSTMARSLIVLRAEPAVTCGGRCSGPGRTCPSHLASRAHRVRSRHRVNPLPPHPAHSKEKS